MFKLNSNICRPFFPDRLKNGGAKYKMQYFKELQ